MSSLLFDSIFISLLFFALIFNPGWALTGFIVVIVISTLFFGLDFGFEAGLCITYALFPFCCWPFFDARSVRIRRMWARNSIFKASGLVEQNDREQTFMEWNLCTNNFNYWFILTIKYMQPNLGEFYDVFWIY